MENVRFRSYNLLVSFKRSKILLWVYSESNREWEPYINLKSVGLMSVYIAKAKAPTAELHFSEDGHFRFQTNLHLIMFKTHGLEIM